ncbi:glycosyltransferase family 4 protein [Salinisphaera shabanensis]|nr:glycosyltransferase family 4 protein [Salinisphaera shabanensis]
MIGRQFIGHGNSILGAIINFLFITADQSSRGGTERAVSNLAIMLDEIGGHQINVLSIRGGASSFFPMPEGANLATLNHPKKRWLKQLSLPLEIISAIRNTGPDVVIAVDSVHFFYLAAATGLFPKIRFWCWEHFNALSTLGIRRRGLGRRLASILADAVIVLTTEDRRYWRALFGTSPSRLVVIPNPIPHSSAVASPSEDLSPRDATMDGAQSLPNSCARKTVLAAGRLEEQKGFDLLLRSWALIPQRNRAGWLLKIAGEGRLKSELEALAFELGVRDSVEFLGYVDLSYEMCVSDIFALSSRFEGFALVLLEAVSAGLPCVAFSCPSGPKEIVDHGRSGYLVPPGDTVSFAKRLNGLMQSDDLRDKFGEYSAISAERFAWPMVRRKWAELL